MTDRPTGQLNTSAADYYEEYFVPSLFKERTGPLLDLAGISQGSSVLDVGCGTGILARAAWERLEGSGTVIGIDRNDGMIATARRVAPEVEWRIGQAESLPFEDAGFDHVISQFALMFFEDRAGGLAEMWRVTKPGGRLTLAVWDRLENTPGYAAMTEIDARLFGDDPLDRARISRHPTSDMANRKAISRTWESLSKTKASKSASIQDRLLNNPRIVHQLVLSNEPSAALLLAASMKFPKFPPSNPGAVWWPRYSTISTRM